MFIEYILGLLGSILVTIAYVPQVVMTVKTKHTKGISLQWLLILTIALIMYTIYGFSINSIPVIISSGVGGGLVIILLAYKLKYK